MFAPLQEHSHKPEEQYAVIDRVSGTDGPRLELFARRRQPGWDVWGNEIESDIDIPGYPVPRRSNASATEQPGVVMNDEQRLAELPTYSRMAWSSRPVWDRRPAVGKRRNRHPDLGVARRHRPHDGGRRSSRDRVHALARSKSLVVDGAQAREETL